MVAPPPEGGNNVGIVTNEERTMPAGSIVSLKGNILYGLNSGNGAIHWDHYCVNVGTCTTDIVSPVNADYNAKFNNISTVTCAGCTNQGGGYISKYSATPGTHDVVADPKFLDRTRYLLPWSIQYLGRSVCTPWVASHSYSAGDCVSITNASYYGGKPINYIAMAANTSSSSNQPGAAYSSVGLNALTVWLPETLSIVQSALLTGLTISDMQIGCLKCSYPLAILKWARAGRMPMNPAVWNARADDHTTPGAVQPVMSIGISSMFRKVNP
jgi:hypothetical protein